MHELLTFILSHSDQFRRQRLPSLYSDFTPQRHTNPDGFAVNASAWINVLGKAAEAGLLPSDGGNRDILSLTTGDALLQGLETEELGRPLALGAVIHEAVSQCQMMLYRDFLQARRSIYDRSWTVHPWQLVSWGLRQFGYLEPSSTGNGTLPQGRYVILRNVEEAASKIMRQMGRDSNQINRIYPMPFFRAEVGKMVSLNDTISESDLQIILAYLSREKSAIVYNDHLVKFKARGETAVTISGQDSTISALKTIIADLNVQVAQLSGRITTLSDEAQEAFRSKNRVATLAALRSKKLNETTLIQRSETLAQLEEVYRKIEQAADQATIVRVMEASTAVLQGLHAKTGGINHVDDVVEGLRDEMCKVDEVSSALEAGRSGDNMIDETAVNEELEQMEKQAKLDEEKAQALEKQEKLSSIGDLIKENEVPGEPQRLGAAEAQEASVEKSVKALRRLSLERQAVPAIQRSDTSQDFREREPNIASEDLRSS